MVVLFPKMLLFFLSSRLGMCSFFWHFWIWQKFSSGRGILCCTCRFSIQEGLRRTSTQCDIYANHLEKAFQISRLNFGHKVRPKFWTRLCIVAYRHKNLWTFFSISSYLKKSFLKFHFSVNWWFIRLENVYRRWRPHGLGYHGGSDFKVGVTIMSSTQSSHEIINSNGSKEKNSQQIAKMLQYDSFIISPS